MESIIIFLVVGIVFYILYQNGYMITGHKRALSFMGSQGGKKAHFTRCQGYIKRMVRFRQDGLCHFSLKEELAMGSIRVEIQGPKKEVLLQLSSEETKTLAVEKGKKYFLVIHFESATGSYEIDWN